MPITATYGIAGKDAGILAIAFPGVRVVRDADFFPFIAEKRLIVITETNPSIKYPNKDLIHIRRRAKLMLDSRRGFLRFLGTIGVKASNAEVAALLMMQDEEFWQQAKIATILKGSPTLDVTAIRDRQYALFRMFSALFENFDAVYREYDLIKDTMSRRQILSALMTMIQKSSNAHRIGGLSPQYKKILLKNRPFRRLFDRELLRFLGTRQTEWMFLGFLAKCSSHTRPSVWGRRRV